MNVEQIISELKKSNLYAECPKCDEEFKLAKSILFDGTKPFPKKALEAQNTLEKILEDKTNELEKRRKLATVKAQITARSVNIGKSLEKICPTLRDFNLELPDCRFLGDPIDLITFNGLSNNKVDSISFIEIKSGGSRLSEHQKSIQDAIEDKKVTYELFR